MLDKLRKLNFFLAIRLQPSLRTPPWAAPAPALPLRPAALALLPAAASTVALEHLRSCKLFDAKAELAKLQDSAHFHPFGSFPNFSSNAKVVIVKDTFDQTAGPL